MSFVLLCEASDGARLCGRCIILSFKGSKSKRVASSTLHAECLALVSATEEAAFLQSWLLELSCPTLKTFELIQVPPTLHIGIVAVIDCKDLLDVLLRAAITAVTNKALILYFAALRELKETLRVEQWVWTDTRDNVSNSFTKINADGSLPAEPVEHLLKHGAWEPQFPFLWGHQHVDPTTFDFVAFPPVPETPTAFPTFGTCFEDFES